MMIMIIISAGFAGSCIESKSIDDDPEGIGILLFIVVYHFVRPMGKHFTEVKVVMGGGHRGYAERRESAV